MPDVEKVIKGLECCSVPADKRDCDSCPIGFGEGCALKLKRAALALLKVQEPPTSESISSAIECLLHPQDADDSDMAKAIDTAVRAMRLMKAQEPRVMTLEEVLATEVVYAEDVDKADIIPVLVDRRAHDRIVLVRARLMGSPSLSIYPLISEYNKRWRCWTSRPDQATREAIPWN